MILSCSLTWTLKIEKIDNMDGGTMLKSENSVTFVSLGDLSVQVGKCCWFLPDARPSQLKQAKCI